MPITQSTILPLKYGEFRIAYHKVGDSSCISLSHGDLQTTTPVIRLHSSCLFGEAFHALDCDCAAQLSSTLKLIKQNKSGAIIYRYMEGRGVGLENKIKALELQRTHNINTVDAFKKLGFEPDIRTYDEEIIALRELESSDYIKIAGQNPNKRRALERGGFTMVEQLHPIIKLTKHNVPELLTKKHILGYNILLELGLE